MIWALHFLVEKGWFLKLDDKEAEEVQQGNKGQLEYGSLAVMALESLEYVGGTESETLRTEY